MPPSPVFQVDSGTGRVTVASPSLNYEVLNSYTLNLRVTDSAGLYAEAPLTISVVDDNDPPSLAPATLSISENSAIDSM